MRNELLKMIAIALLVAGCGGGGGGSDSSPVTGPLPAPPPSAGQVGDGRVDEILEWARSFQGVPAMAMVLDRNRQIAETGAVGRRSAGADVMVTKNGRWRLGSLTRAMTATLAGTLVDQSIISWQTRPVDVWPELDGGLLLVVYADGDRANAAIDLVEDVIPERFQASR